MNRSLCTVVAVTGILCAAGCADNQTRIGEGAGIGGLGGALIGGIVGHQSGNGVAGALIGGAVGATGGAIAGSQINKPSQSAPQAYAPAANGNVVTSVAPPPTGVPLTMQQVVDMSRQGTPSDEIIAQIQSTHSVYALTADDINYLRKNSVSQRVIEVMQATR